MSLSPGGVFEFVGAGSLAEHWEEHQATDPDLGFGEFLFMHYFDPAHDNADPVDHGKLPFHHQSVAAMVCIPSGDPLQPTLFTPRSNPPFVRSMTGKPVGVSIPIFHPPQG
ncbi:MAG: hypothetical protein KIT10_06860 [Flavobacteriales bacterium]|nr:hypothetical protein [Flavobacteriales bacterium]